MLNGDVIWQACELHEHYIRARTRDFAFTGARNFLHNLSLVRLVLISSITAASNTHFRLVQTSVKRLHLCSKIKNFLTDHNLCVRKNWPILLRFTRSVWMSLYFVSGNITARLAYSLTRLESVRSFTRYKYQEIFLFCRIQSSQTINQLHRYFPPKVSVYWLKPHCV